MKNVLLSTKLKNRVKELDDTIIPIKLTNTIINGEKRGCSGFFYNTNNGNYVFVDTEESCYGPLQGMALVRYAKDESDYRGERNNFVAREVCAEEIVRMLKVPRTKTWYIIHPSSGEEVDGPKFKNVDAAEEYAKTNHISGHILFIKKTRGNVQSAFVKQV